MCKNNMKRISLYVASVMFAFIRLNAFAQPSDRAGSDSLPDNYGVCLYAGGEATGVRMDEPFAMHSIMKFPQAVYVAHCMESRKIPLHETVRVRKSELMQDTWSPMLRMFEGEKDFSCAELLGLSLAQSDNNACDILFRRFGGPAQVEAYLHELGFTRIHVRWTEQEMGEPFRCQQLHAQGHGAPLRMVLPQKGRERIPAFRMGNHDSLPDRDRAHNLRHTRGLRVCPQDGYGLSVG